LISNTRALITAPYRARSANARSNPYDIIRIAAAPVAGRPTEILRSLVFKEFVPLSVKSYPETIVSHVKGESIDLVRSGFFLRDFYVLF
jgi:hypothetical protein